MRLRQVALVAADLEPTLDAIGSVLALDVCFRDPGVAEFGLANGLFAIGDQFLEVVSPVKDGTTAGRLLDKRNGDGGYMVIMQAESSDELSRVNERCAALGVRVVWQGELNRTVAGEQHRIRGRHLHPRDIGGAIVSIDLAEPASSWLWAGDAWKSAANTSVAKAICGVVIGADDPSNMAQRWADVLNLAAPTAVGDTSILELSDARIEFVPAGERGEGVDALLLRAGPSGPAGTHAEVCGTAITFV